jgi:group I intron endonuclease
VGKHGNDCLQHSFNKHGEHCFLFSVIETVEHDALDEREVHWISKLDAFSCGNGYNIMNGGNNVGPFPESVRRKISKALMGRKVDPAVVAKTAKANRGKKRSLETRIRMSGRRPGPEERALLSVCMKGRVVSQATRDKISATLKSQSDVLRARATGVPCLPETRQKIAEKLRRRKLSKTHRMNIAAGGIGRHPTAETRAKISAFHKGNKWGLGTKRSAATRAILSQKAKIRESLRRQKCSMNNNAVQLILL